MNSIHTFVVLAYKESQYLEECIKSVLDQEYKSKVVIATTTDNKFIRNLAQKYHLEVIVGKHTNIGGDFDFAIKCSDTPLVTIAHQDDLYDKNYSKKVVDAYTKDATIIFTDYYEIREKEKVHNNRNLKIKRILLTPLKFRSLSGRTWAKRFVLRFGNAISCPAVTFNKENLEFPVFEYDMTCDIDWHAWEKLSRKKGKFIFIKDHLMGHRVHEDSETTKTISENRRTKEDLEIFKRFWPEWFAKKINTFYSKSEESNNV